jgi:uncharacterized membrane protein YoaK (UPF0700 family)
MDTISFLGLDRLFTAHVTGNFVILAARLAAGNSAPLAHLLALPIFALAVGAARMFAISLEARRIEPLVPLLGLQFLFIAAFLVIVMSASPGVSPESTEMVVGAMLGVAAMAVQNSAVRISLDGAPSTVVMTMNVTAMSMDLADILFRRGTDAAVRARRHTWITWPTIAGFFFGCALGALGETRLGLGALVAPAVFALIALILGMSAQDATHRAATPPPRS